MQNTLGALNYEFNSCQGAKCDKLPIVDCSSDPCNNGGSCIDVDNHFICSCPPEWYGAICDKEVIKCSSNPCSKNGQCENKENGFFCKCKTGWKGIFLFVHFNLLKTNAINCGQNMVVVLYELLFTKVRISRNLCEFQVPHKILSSTFVSDQK